MSLGPIVPIYAIDFKEVIYTISMQLVSKDADWFGLRLIDADFNLHFNFIHWNSSQFVALFSTKPTLVNRARFLQNLVQFAQKSGQSLQNTSGYKCGLELYRSISMLTWLSNIFMLEIICLLSMSFCCMDTRNTANISSKYITYIITQLGGMHNNFGVFLVLISVGFDKCTILQVFSLTNICSNHWDQLNVKE